MNKKTDWLKSIGSSVEQVGVNCQGNFSVLMGVRIWLEKERSVRCLVFKLRFEVSDGLSLSVDYLEKKRGFEVGKG